MNKHGKHLIAAAMMLGSAASGVAFAADEPAAAAPTAPSLSDVLTASGITMTGYIAASYYHSNGYPYNIHQFDTRHDSFQLDQAGFSVAYQPKEGFGGLVDLIAGEDARSLHAAEDGNDNSFDVRQAFLQYATGPLTIMAGKFVTLAGAEVINPTLNTNYSRSLLFFDSEPLTHTGIRASYAVTDTITVTGGVNNGWNTTSTNYGSKTGELSVAWTAPNKMFALAGNAYFGKNDPSFYGFDAEKTLIDVVATYNATSQLTFIINFDWDQQKFADNSPSASWNGAALYVNYAFNDQWRVSVRGEYLDDKDGFVTGEHQTLKEGTVTFAYMPTKSFEFRVEGRYDKAQTPLFVRALNSSEEGGGRIFQQPDGFALQGHLQVLSNASGAIQSYCVVLKGPGLRRGLSIFHLREDANDSRRCS